MTDKNPAIPAATLVMMRERPDGPPDLLMIERAGTMAFAAGAMVFPGGRIDPGDHVLAANPALATPIADPLDAAARVAAIRESVEEVGIAVGFVADHDTIAALRIGLHAGKDFGTLLAGYGLRLDLEALTPFARWRPNFPEVRVFDTRFYLAAPPEDALAAADGGESVHAVWATAAHVIAEADAGRMHIIFPTRRNLERLRQFACLADAQTHAAAHPVRLVTPWVEERDGERWLCIPDDLGYPVTAERAASALRG